ncbi:MAG: prepilin-type N-terminal cleavage/methylation domain-containing protein [Bacilli bacterium]|nr:prepilin-type N-terminal cleavage/methylation domain-containing protein [Bacilli bacterium]
MKKSGFTLVELLAVIVILAIIALIAFPQITNVVEKARKVEVKSSALNYVDAIEKSVILSSLTGQQYDNREYIFDEIDVKIKGQGPTAGRFDLLNGKVTNALFCIDGYTATYNGENVTVGAKCTSDDLKYDSTLNVSKTSVALTYPNNDTIEILENTSGGELSCESDDSSIATCEISGNNLVIKPGTSEGATTITLKSKGSSKYKEATVAIAASTEHGILSVTSNGYNAPFDGNAHGITVTSSGATIKYGLTEGTYDLTENPTYTNVGTYTVYYEVTKEGYKTVTGSEVIKIIEIPTYKINWTKTISGNGSATSTNNIGSYLGEGSLAATNSNKYYHKRIVYTAADGKTHYANPYVATTIYIKQGTAIQFQKYADSHESYIRIDKPKGTVKVQKSTTTKYGLLTVSYTPTSNATISGYADENTRSVANYWYINF